MTSARTVAFSKQATNIFFHILTGCNLSCRHCYINPEQHGHQTLPLATIERWLNAFAEKADRANLVLLGGEPTMHPDLAAVVKLARGLGFQSITIDTNGYLFHDIIERVSPEEVNFLVSVWMGPPVKPMITSVDLAVTMRVWQESARRWRLALTPA